MTMTAAETASNSPADYKSGIKPIWCPGCGDFAVLTSITKAFAELALEPEQTVFVSGIGCSSRMPAYTSTYGFHGVHGRALPLATGVKLARPELTVMVAGGDGDGLSIGGNHFMHACRRNVDLTYLVMDNQVYGMTKGQPSPTTDADWESKLNPDGTGVDPINPALMALTAGASFVARGFSGDVEGVKSLIMEGIRHPGFAVIQILSPCITFRPEQTGWKRQWRAGAWSQTEDLAAALEIASRSDYLETGVLYRSKRAPYPSTKGEASLRIKDIEAGFAI